MNQNQTGENKKMGTTIEQLRDMMAEQLEKVSLGDAVYPNELLQQLGYELKQVKKIAIAMALKKKGYQRRNFKGKFVYVLDDPRPAENMREQTPELCEEFIVIPPSSPVRTDESNESPGQKNFWRTDLLIALGLALIIVIAVAIGST